jgi:hypothetical protein
LSQSQPHARLHPRTIEAVKERADIVDELLGIGGGLLRIGHRLLA